MKILVACEYSGVVREAFRSKGHHAVSVDLIPCEHPTIYHIEGDVRRFLDQDWDMMVAFPPCTHLATSGARWFKNKVKEQEDSLKFIELLLSAPINKIALENPVGVISTKIRKPDQIIQPYQFGEPYSKKTCLWLKNLPLLSPTKVVDRGERHITKSGRSLPKWYNLPPSTDRWKIRSRTFQGIADAMADQWSDS